MPQSFAYLNCHIIFSTKNREPLLMPEWATRLYEYIGGTIRAKGGALLAAGGMPDHVHFSVSMGRQMSVSDAVRDIKSNSSRWIHETIADLRGFAWQEGYGAFSVSRSNVDDVKRYIGSQAEHHRVRSFQEEFLEFLKRHELEYDERYIWD
jgi:REP element-mobilizing transposase RayT